MTKAIIFSSLLISASVMLAALMITRAAQDLQKEIHAVSRGPFYVSVASSSTEGLKIAPIQSLGSVSVNASVIANGNALRVQQVAPSPNR